MQSSDVTWLLAMLEDGVFVAPDMKEYEISG